MARRNTAIAIALVGASWRQTPRRLCATTSVARVLVHRQGRQMPVPLSGHLMVETRVRVCWSPILSGAFGSTLYAWSFSRTRLPRSDAVLWITRLFTEPLISNLNGPRDHFNPTYARCHSAIGLREPSRYFVAHAILRDGQPKVTNELS